MRVPKYLSPTSIHLFYQDPEEFYLKYISETRMPRFPQTKPMSIGSAFDAYVKSYLHERLFGKSDRFQLEAIFEEQVEPHNRDWALIHGKLVFEQYKSAGCLADLMLELNQAIGAPRFEFAVQDTIETDIGGIPLLGKPDVFFTNSQGARVVYDWKVNGYCAPRLTSPMKGYVKLRTRRKGSNVQYDIKQHPNCIAISFNGIMINAAMFLEEGNKDWADQLAIYSWLLGEPIGSEKVIFGIDQVTGPEDGLRFASHRLRIRPEHQYHLIDLIKILWDSILKNHIFRELTVDESRQRGQILEDMMLKDGGMTDDEADLFASMTE